MLVMGVSVLGRRGEGIPSERSKQVARDSETKILGSGFYIWSLWP